MTTVTQVDIELLIVYLLSILLVAMPDARVQLLC